MIQLNLFKSQDEVFVDEIIQTKEQLGSLRRGIFARYDRLLKKVEKMEKRLKNIESGKIIEFPLLDLLDVNEHK